MSDYSKNVRTAPVPEKPKTVCCSDQEIFVDPDEIDIDDGHYDPSEDERACIRYSTDPYEIGIDDPRGYSYDHSERDHGWGNSGRGNPHDGD
jgi:hypothetical protein